MRYRSFRFFNKRATVLRANYMVDITTIRDRVLTDYSTVRTRIPCMKEPLGGDIINHDLVGMIAVDRFEVHLPGKAPVLPNDVLLIDGEYYNVGTIEDHGDNDWEMVAHCTKKNLQRE